MSYYEDNMTTITCAHCNSFNAKCNTTMLLTSEPPQYGCHCPDCKKIWYIYTHQLNEYLPKPQAVSSASNLTELEARVKVLEELVKKLQVQVDVARFF